MLKMLHHAGIPYTTGRPQHTEYPDARFHITVVSNDQPHPHGYLCFLTEMAFDARGNLYGVWAWE